MKNFIIVAMVLVLVGGGVWFASQKKTTSEVKTKTPEVQALKIGVIFKGENFKQIVDGFQDGLSNIVGQKNYRIDYLVEEVVGAEQADFDLAAQHLMDAKVDLILAVAVEAVVAAKKVTVESKTPILLVIGSNPVPLKLVTSLQKPEGNVTGVTLQVEELAGKRLELLKTIDPRVKSVVIFKKKGTKVIENSLISVNSVAKNLGIKVTVREVDTREDFEKAAAAISRPEFDSIFYAADPFIARNADVMNKNLLRAKMPNVGPDESSVRKGALSSYGANFVGAGEQAARLAAKILIDKQTPSEVPVESVNKIDFVINLATAKKIGLTFPAEMVSLAQIVIPE